jgi:ABC-type Zn uptake system ZnuABC Zn-binding protein ZnuA
MKPRIPFWIAALLALPLLLLHQDALASGDKAGGPGIKVLAIETFLADMARQVSGERLKVAALLPMGADPHGFEPTPADVTKVAGSNVLIINGAGFEGYLDVLLRNAGGVHRIIDASAGLTDRKTGAGEGAGTDNHGEHRGGERHDETEHRHKGADHHEAGQDRQGHHHERDPHFWLAPNNAVKYVENIRNGLSEADPDGAVTYAANADAYTIKLKELDLWITDQVRQVPESRRLLVTNHESFGYFADRYGFKIIGTVIPNVSTGAAPSAKQMVELIERIKKTRVKAVFLETGANPQLAAQIAKEAGIQVVTELYTHSITEPGGPAPNYIEMIRYNTTAIVNALK